MKLNRVVLTKPEAEWLQRNVVKTIKILEGAAKKDPQVTERVTYKTLKRVAEGNIKFFDEEGSAEVMLSRKQKQVVGHMVLQTLTILQDRIIPEYTKRNLTEYLDDAKIKSEILKSMYRKLQ